MTLPTPQNDLVRGALSKIAAMGESERYWRINAAEAIWDGCDPQPRPSFWDKSVPLQERAPAVRSMLARTAGRRLASMIFGERSWPRVTPRATAYQVTLSQTDLDAIGALLDELCDVASLRVVMHQALVQGLRSGSVCMVLCFRDGLPAVDFVPAKWCTPDLSPSGAVRSVLVEWQTLGKDDKGNNVLYAHRRTIDASADTTFVPQVNDGRPLTWSRVEQSYALEFCPVVWCRNQVDPTDTGCDGYPLAHGLEDEIGALDLALSQGHRNALYNGEPQMVRTGVDAEAPPMGPEGRNVDPEKFSWLNAPKNALNALSGWVTGAASGAAKKAPGTIWNLPTGSDAKLLESTGAGMTIIGQNADRLRRVILDAVGVVLADPQTLGSGDISARALTLMHAPMLDVCDNLREEYGRLLLSVLDGFFRLCTTATVREGALLSSLAAALPALDRQKRVRVDGSAAWLALPLSLTWGPYFEPSWSDVTAGIAAARAGFEGGIVSRETAVRMIAPLTGVTDTDEELEDLDEGESERADTMRSVLGSTPPPPPSGIDEPHEEPHEEPEADGG
jgi:hypothetical protein